MQHPLLVPLEGGQADPARREREWIDAWVVIARGCEEALTRLPLGHPRRDELLALTRDARAAGQLPDVFDLRTA